MASPRLRIAHIGLGDIARKAYLPITTSHPQVTPILCTRNKVVLEELSQQYRIKDAFNNIDELIKAKPDGAMLHTATTGHFSLASQLLTAKIPVFVDKPVSNSYGQTAKLFDLACKQNVPLFVGFNRRYAPLIKNLYKSPKPNHIYWQKHRVNLPGNPRTFIFDDFIHVVDSLLIWSSTAPKDLQVHAQMDGKQLTSLQVQWTVDNTLYSGYMNRVSGTPQERVEFFAPGVKVQIEELNKGVRYDNGQLQEVGFENWKSTLYKRGFVTMINQWLKTVDQATFSNIAALRDLRTHRICEEILAQVLKTKQ